MPRSIASIATAPKASPHSDGTSRTRVSAKNVSTSSDGGRIRTLASSSRAARSAAVVPQVGTAANATSGSRRASSRKMEIPLTAHGFTRVTNPRSKRPRQGGSP